MLSQRLLKFNLKLGIAKFWNLCYYTLRKEINGYYVILY